MLTRRSFVSLAGATAGALLLPEFSRADDNPQSPKGLVKGEPTAEKVGERVLAEGGNAFDAIVAAVSAQARLGSQQDQDRRDSALIARGVGLSH